MRSLLLVESFEFRPSNQYILVRVIPSCFRFAKMCLCQISLCWVPLLAEGAGLSTILRPGTEAAVVPAGSCLLQRRVGRAICCRCRAGNNVVLDFRSVNGTRKKCWQCHV
jgi:hypothetical protein